MGREIGQLKADNTTLNQRVKVIRQLKAEHDTLKGQVDIVKENQDIHKAVNGVSLCFVMLNWN